MIYLVADAVSMIRDIRATGGVVGKWGGLLNIPQLLGGLLFIWTPEGAAVFICVVVTLMIAGQIHKTTPFSRRIGICHAPWVLLLPWLIHRIMAHEHGLLLKIWLIYVAATIAVSLVFDARDLWLYRKGEKRFAWAK
ncbi:MAG: hypothetical protein AAF401_07440 [Pseudomonadota bacterium]